MNFVNSDKLQELNDKVYENAGVDREHLLDFLKIVDTSDGQEIVKAVEQWLSDLHEDPKFSKVSFPSGDIDAILGDLDSYGRVQAETILRFKENSNKTMTA